MIGSARFDGSKRTEILRATRLSSTLRRKRSVHKDTVSQKRVSTMLIHSRRRLDAILDRLEAEGQADVAIFLTHDDIDNLCGEMIAELDAGTEVPITQDRYRGHPYYAIDDDESFVAYIDRVTRKREQDYLCYQPVAA